MAIEVILENSEPLQIQKGFENARLLLQNNSKSWACVFQGNIPLTEYIFNGIMLQVKNWEKSKS